MDHTNFRVLVAAVVGAGVVIGTAGVFIYNQLFEERRRLMHQQGEIQKLDQTVSSLREELDALRKLQQSSKKSSANRRPHHRSSSTLDRESEVDMYSAIGTDEGSDEFYDLSDGEDDFDAISTGKLGSQGDQPDDPVLAQLLSTVDVLLRGPSEDRRVAYRQLKEQLSTDPDCCGVWWRAAWACHSVAAIHGLDGDSNKKKELTEEGISYAEKALELDSDCAEAHKWYAILVGSRSEFQSTKDKITDGFVFKSHVDTALALRPNDASLYHLLGRFKYEVAMLTWIERKLASTLFAEPPSASVQDALSDFLRAEELHATPWKENRLLLAKCCIAEGGYATAVRWLDKATEVPVVTADDENVQKDVDTLLAKYSSYRSSP